MLSRQLSQASSWRRSSVCLLCARRSQLLPPQCRPFSATRALLKRETAAKGRESTLKLRKILTEGKDPAAKGDDTAQKPRPKAKRAPKPGRKPSSQKQREAGEEADEAHASGEANTKSLKDALLGTEAEREQRASEARDRLEIRTMYPERLAFEPVDAAKPPVPMLSYGLDRVLFNPGVYRLQDPRSRVYNFDPYLEKIMPVNEFDFDALSEYKTSSKDEELLALTKRIGSKYTGSTSSMSGILQHFHYVLSNFRKLNHTMLSRTFPEPSPRFSKITLGPSAIFLRHKDGVYAIDADKSYDNPNIMSWLGHSLEKLLTTERSEFERFRRSNPEKPPPEDNASRCYHYSRQGNIMMRSQLDAVDPRLPGTGVFDLKTRAVVSIRMNHREYEQGAGYQLRHALGEWESFEREFYDMTRATLLKYSLQVRMGRMDGIFVAYHNIERIFGFQYLSLADMDAVLHGQHDTRLGDEEFKLSIGLVDEILTKAITQFPDTSIRLHVEAREGKMPFLYVFAEPVTEEQADEIQSTGEDAQRKFAKNVVGIVKEDDQVQAAWQDIQNNVDEQVGEDQNLASAPKNEEDTQTVSEEETQTVSEDTTEGAEENAAAAVDTPTGPLMGWTLTVRSLVNGEYVERPSLDEEDEWKIEYHLKEIAEGQRWKLYNAVKERRRQLVGQNEEEQNKGLQHYRDLIGRFSKRGRKWRKEQDAIDSVKGVQMYRPLGPGSGAVEFGEDMKEAESDVEDTTEAESGVEESGEDAKEVESDIEGVAEAEPGAEGLKEEESDIEETKEGESLSQEKKEEVLDGVPASPS